MSATVFTGTVAHALKKTLQSIVTDSTDGIEAKTIMPKWYTEQNMPDNWMDDLEVAGTPLLAEKTDGAQIQALTIKEGYLYRYIARTFAGKVIVTEEAMEDQKYPQVIDAAVRLKRSFWKTVDVDSTLPLIRATNSAYVYGDGQTLASATHPLAQGGSFSNQLATALSPSRSAVIIATTQVMQYPSQDGIVEGYTPKCIVHPVAQWATWKAIIGSEKAPEPGQFNQINVAYSMGLDLVPNKYWNNTVSNWIMLTDAEDGFKFLWRRRIRNRTWVDNDQDLMKYGVSGRWTRGNSNPRSLLFSNS
jgi:hypothetical protein